MQYQRKVTKSLRDFLPRRYFPHCSRLVSLRRLLHKVPRGAYSYLICASPYRMHSLAKNLSFRFKEVYGSCAELCGHVLKYMSGQCDSSWKTLLEMFIKAVHKEVCFKVTLYNTLCIILVGNVKAHRGESVSLLFIENPVQLPGNTGKVRSVCMMK